VKKLMEVGAAVVVERRANAKGNWPMTITGPDEIVQQVAAMVRSKLIKAVLHTPDHEYCEPPAGFFIQNREIERKYQSSIMGKGGEVIRQICQESGAEMEFRNGQWGRYLRMVGTKEALAAANELINFYSGNMWAEQWDESVAGDPSATVQASSQWEGYDSIQVETRYIGRIVGKGGETVKQIEEQSGVHVWIPPAEARSGTTAEVWISGVGTPGNQTARDLIQAKVRPR